MFDTKKKKHLRQIFVLYTVLSLFLPVGLLSTKNAGAATNETHKPAEGLANAGKSRSATVVPTPLIKHHGKTIKPASTSSSYDHCIQDDTNPTIGLSFNATSGAFICSSGGQTLFSGTGHKSTVNGCTVFSGSSGGNSVTANYSGTGCNTANATIVYNYAPGLFKTIRIADANVANDQCATGASVALLSPNGGEILDVGSSFNIMWTAFDQSGILTQDLQLSTDGGSTFSNIITGLGPDVTSYTWAVPSIANSTAVVIQITVHDAAGVTETATSDSTFTIWNPAANYTHVAEAPIYLVSGSIVNDGGGSNGSTSLAVQDSTVELCNESSSSVSVELALRERSGNIGSPAPVTVTVTPHMHHTVALSSLFAFSTDPVTFTGSIRLRHNGSSDADIRALILITTNDETQSFTVPFTYPASAQSASSSVQYAPIYYLGGAEPSAILSLQNATNNPVTTNLTVTYGDGGLAGTAGQLSLSPVTLYAQQTAYVDISQLSGNLQGSTWGSIQLSAAPQSVVAYLVSGDLSTGMKFGSNFRDPAVSTQTAFTAAGLDIDSASGRAASLMVSNNAAVSRTVNINYQSDSGVSIPPSQVTLAPGQQKLIQLTPGQILPGGGSTMADARISYTGNPGDISAGAVSLSSTDGRAVPAQFVEVSPGDGRVLVAPFFWFDERVAGIVQISNLGASGIKAGVMMDFDDPELLPLNTDAVSIPAGGTVTINLQNYFSVFEDGVSARGCLEVMHNGSPGTVAASFIALGVYSGIGLAIPMQGGPQVANTDMALFPNQVDLGDDDVSQTFSAMTGASLSAPTWSVSSTVGNPGSIAGQTQSDPLVFPAAYTPPTDPSTLTVTVKADASSSGGPVETAAVAVNKVKLVGFTTGAGHARLSSTSPTTFTLRSKTGTPFPIGTLSVRFQQNRQTILATDVARTDNNTLTGTAPTNNLFVGDCTVLVVDSNGNKISKDSLATTNAAGGGGAYYAYDPPSATASLSPDSHDRTKITNLTVTGSGYGSFTPTSLPAVFPTVFIGSDLLGSLTVTPPTSISGRLPRNPDDKACPTGSKCQQLTVGNPGHRSADLVVTPGAYELMPGPSPTITSISPNRGLSTGGTEVTIGGTNLDFVNLVTLAGVPLQIQSGSVADGGGSLRVRTLPNCAGNATFSVTSIDHLSFNFTTAPFTFEFSPVAIVSATGAGGLPFGVQARYFAFVGPCPSEGVQQVSVSVSMTANGSSINSCVTPQFSVNHIPLPDPRFPTLDPSLNVFEIDVSLTDGCQVGNPPGSVTYAGTVSFQLANTAAVGDSALFTKKQSFNFFFNK